MDGICSAASAVDPSTILGSGPTESATVGQTTAGQAATEQPMAQTATAPTTEEITEDPTREGTDANAPTKDEIRAPSPTQVEEPQVETAAPEGTPNLSRRPMMSLAMVVRSAEGEGTQADSDDEVEEIQGRPHDGRQHIYV